MSPRSKTLERVAAEKAAVLFERFGWTYAQKDGKSVKPFIPSAKHLEKTVHRLIDTLYASESFEVGSGRFVVRRHDYENGNGTRVLLDLGETNVYTGEVMGE